MGSVSSTISGLVFGPKEHRVLVLGLDNAGKTTISFQLRRLEKQVDVVGFAVETLKVDNLSFTFWDVSGQEKMRPLWRHYFHGTSCVIFVIDGADRDQLPEAARELDLLLNEPLLADVPFLIFNNKQDLPHAIPTSELTDILDLGRYNRSKGETEEGGRKWKIQPLIATTGDGLAEGLDWVKRILQ